MIVSNPKVKHIIETAQLCEAFHCLPSELRKEDPDELFLVGETILKLRQKMNPLNKIGESLNGKC